MILIILTLKEPYVSGDPTVLLFPSRFRLIISNDGSKLFKYRPIVKKRK